MTAVWKVVKELHDDDVNEDGCEAIDNNTTVEDYPDDLAEGRSLVAVNCADDESSLVVY